MWQFIIGCLVVGIVGFAALVVGVVLYAEHLINKER